MGLHILPTCIILATLFARARADGLDDFTNNLFSDLGPILALFGERVTMQFMSQATNWVDCFTLAMAPLGIITIIVSAIRVGGPQKLKAIIGRARENTAAAEMELMSSTSKEVCELFNGESFIRCQGKAPVWEYICIIPKTANLGEEGRLQFMTLDDAVDNSLLSKHEGGTRLHLPFARDKTSESTPTPNTGDATGGIWSGAKRRFNLGILRRRRAKEARDVENQTSARLDDLANGKSDTIEECITVIRQITDNAPNITLNLQEASLQKTISRIWINFIAVLGGLLQVGVLAFCGVISYDPRLQPDFQKDGKPAASYGFPLAAGGTILLLTGVFLCALVVERSTKEMVYKAKEGHEIRVYWIQRSQIISDQIFDSFAILPQQDLPLTSLIKSTRHQDIINGAGNGKKRTTLQVMTIIGVPIGLLGFIAQFTGLRAMNSAASLAQLAAVAIMTGCRAFARPGFSSSFEKHKLLSGFELDWLARKLVAGKRNAPTGQENGQPESNEQPTPDEPVAGSWAVLTGEMVMYKALEPLTEKRKESEAHEVLVTRRELYKLAEFQGQTSKEALNLATAIEAVLRTLFPNGPSEPTSGESCNSDPWPSKSTASKSTASKSTASKSTASKSTASKSTASKSAARESCNSDLSPAKSIGRWSSNLDASHNQEGEGFRWLVNVTHSSSVLTESPEQETQVEVGFDLKYTATDKSWRVRADSLDAALSLWVYTVREREKQQSGGTKQQSGGTKQQSGGTKQQSGGTKQQSNGTKDENTNCVGEENDEWFRRKVAQPCLRLFNPGKMPKAQLLQDLEWWAPQSTEHLLQVEEIPNSTDGQTEPTDSESFHAARVVGCSPSSASNINLQKRSFRISSEDMESDKSTLAIESRDSLERLYAKDLLFSFMCSAAKTSGAAIEGGAELRTVATGNRAPKILRHKKIESLVDSFRSNIFESDHEALISIIAPLSMGEILPFPHALLESMRKEIAEDWQFGNALDALDILEDFITQIERYSRGDSGLYESMLAFLLEVHKDAADQAGSLKIDGDETYRLMTTFEDRLKNRIKESIESRTTRPEFFCELRRLFKKSGQLIADGSLIACNHRRCQNSNADGEINSHHEFFATNELPPYFNLTQSHILALEGSFTSLWSFTKEQTNERDFCGRTPLHYAAMNDKNSGVLGRLLLLAGVNVKDHRGYTPLHYACALGRDKNVVVLLSSNAKLDNQATDGMYPMHLAARRGHAGVIRTILRTDTQWRLTEAQRRLTDHDGYLPIHWGAINGHKEVIQQLNADINVCNAQRATPLHLAVLHGKVDVVKALLDFSVDMEKTNDNGKTALLLALHIGELEIAKRLIEKGANPNSTGWDGDTPLHCLSRQPRHRWEKQPSGDVSELRRVADALVNNGADIMAKNSEGLTPTELQEYLSSLNTPPR